MKAIACRVILFAVIIAFLSCRQTDAPVKKEVTESRIVFLSNRDRPPRQFDIFTMKLDGTEPVKLTSDVASVTSLSSPQFSPDQKQILFFASAGLEKKLQLMNSDGSGLRTLTAVNIEKPQPHFSPQGDQIVYVSKVGKNRQIHLINVDGSNPANLSNNNYDEFEPQFSPDGSQIVFTSSKDGRRAVYTMRTDGSNLIRRTVDSGTDSYPSFSPDGSKIIFASMRNRNSDIFILELGSSLAQNVTDSKTFESEPGFCPDGSRIFFVSSARGMRYRDIMIKDLHTGEVRNLTKNLNFVNRPVSFSGDGTKLLFESMDASNSEIYIVDLKELLLTNLTEHPKWDCAPSF